MIFRSRRDFDLYRAEEHRLAGSTAVEVIAFSRMATQSGYVCFRSFNLPKQQSISLASGNDLVKTCVWTDPGAQLTSGTLCVWMFIENKTPTVGYPSCKQTFWLMFLRAP